MAGTPGIAARVFSALAARRHQRRRHRAGLLRAQHLVRRRRARRRAEAARAVHARLPALEDRRRPRARSGRVTDVVLLGFGRVGRALAEHDRGHDGGRRVRIVGLLDRSGYVFDPRGLRARGCARLAREEGRRRAARGPRRPRGVGAPRRCASSPSHAVSRPVLVDVTAEETATCCARRSARASTSCSPTRSRSPARRTSYRRLFETRRPRPGAACATRPRSAPGCRSSTPSASSSRAATVCCASRAASAARSASCCRRSRPAAVLGGGARGDAPRLRRARPARGPLGAGRGAQGPDPGRLLGYEGPVPAAESLVPPRCASVPLEQFLARLPALDEEWQRACRGRERPAAACCATSSSATARGRQRRPARGAARLAARLAAGARAT